MYVHTESKHAAINLQSLILVYHYSAPATPLDIYISPKGVGVVWGDEKTVKSISNGYKD